MSNNNDTLTIALPAGRMSEEAIEFLNRIKYLNVQMPNTRELTFYEEKSNVRFLLVRNQDIPLVVLHGGANVGICGRDILYENSYDLTIPISLPFGLCRLSLAISEKMDPNQFFSKSHIRVVTKYPNLTKKYFFEKGINAEIVKLHGSIELGPILGIADCVVDLVSTGRTLKENNLKEIEVLLESSATLIINRASYYIFHQRIQELIKIIQKNIN